MLNFKHLRAFWATAREGSLTGAAAALNVSQSALSVQIQSLEARFGRPLFERRGRRLVLTEAGRIARDHADNIFAMGEELTSIMGDASISARRPLRIGASATLSRNFQFEFLRPLIGDTGVRFVLQSAPTEALMARLEAHALDLVLTDAAPLRGDDAQWATQVIDTQPVGLIGRPRRDHGGDWIAVLREEPLILPSPTNAIRAGFDAIAQRLDIRPQVIAEIDDMAMLRLLTAADVGVAVAPPIVVRGELDAGDLKTLHEFAELEERFLAITPTERFRNPVLDRLLAQAREAPDPGSPPPDHGRPAPPPG